MIIAVTHDDHDHEVTFWGRDMCWKKIRSRFYWWGGKEYVAKKTAECVSCAHKRASIWPAPVPSLRPINVHPQAMWRVHGNSWHKNLLVSFELTLWDPWIRWLLMETVTWLWLYVLSQNTSRLRVNFEILIMNIILHHDPKRFITQPYKLCPRFEIVWLLQPNDI